LEIILTNVRLAFPKIWEPEQFNGQGTARCSASLIMDPKTPEGQKNLKAVQDTIVKVATEKWAAKDPSLKVLATLKAKGDLCLHDGAEKAEYAGFEGNFFVSAANTARPVVCDRNRAPLTQADGKPYGGCYVNAKIDIWAQDNQFGKRVNAKLLVVQFVGDGEAFGGGAVGRAEDMPDMDAGEGGGVDVGNLFG
jgi:hypothetical protein